MSSLLQVLLRLATLRWLGALLCALAMLCAATTASALERVQQKTCVWDFESAAPLNVWLDGAASQRTHLANRDGSKETASDSPHAARGTAGAGRYIRNVICFPPGTLVLMADGTTKAIEDVEEGDLVVAADPESDGETVARRVVGTIENKTQRLFLVEFDSDGDGNADGSFEVTGEHPIWTQNLGWTDAKDLRAGDQLQTDEGVGVEVVALRSRSALSRTHNLSVEGIHTFFIVADGVSILVHNQPVIHPVAPDWAIKGAHVTASNGIELGLRGGGSGVKITPIFARDATNPGLKAAIAEVEAALANPTWRATLLSRTQGATAMLGKGDALARAGSGRTRALEVVLQRWCR